MYTEKGIRGGHRQLSLTYLSIYLSHTYIHSYIWSTSFHSEGSNPYRTILTWSSERSPGGHALGEPSNDSWCSQVPAVQVSGTAVVDAKGPWNLGLIKWRHPWDPEQNSHCLLGPETFYTKIVLVYIFLRIRHSLEGCKGSIRLKLKNDERFSVL